ncbi:UNVERIFIED_CONTAM: hypothetical protein HDU68_009931 [Siphonaria sp. JEL0065]|nr:hypothetical protein HDU68_009931 [Siphonaria sp. JEL0065]
MSHFLPIKTLPIDRQTNVHISFTGGKDSVLVLHLIKNTMPATEIKHLITFSPITNKPFLAHPISFIKKQAEALHLPHMVHYIEGPDYLQAYRSHFTRFYAEDGIDALATGDIEDVCQGFTGNAAEPTGLRMLSPLFQMPRSELLRLFEEYQLKPMITLVSLAHIPLDVAIQLIGQFLDQKTISILETHNVRVACGDLKQREVGGELNKHHLEVDLCGENGEFHTMCMDGSAFESRICIVDKEGKEVNGPNVPTKVSDDGKFLYLDYYTNPLSFALKEKE